MNRRTTAGSPPLKEKLEGVGTEALSIQLHILIGISWNTMSVFQHKKASGAIPDALMSQNKSVAVCRRHAFLMFELQNYLRMTIFFVAE